MSLCDPCDENTCGSPALVTAGKYAVISDKCGKVHPLDNKKNSILVNGSGKNPVRLADGSEGDKICLSELQGAAGASFASIVGMTSSGCLIKAYPNPDDGRVVLVSSAGTMRWEDADLNKHCFETAKLPTIDSSCQFSIAGFANCGPDGLSCLSRIEGENACEVLYADGTFAPPSKPGVVTMWAGNASGVPSGFVICDGRFLDPVDYAPLYEKIGHSFGWNGTLFRAPDMRGMVPRGVTDNVNRDPDYASRTRLHDGGNVAGNVGSYQLWATERHDHLGTGQPIITYSSSSTGSGGPEISYVSFVQGTLHNTFGMVNTDGYNTPRKSTETRMKNIYLHYIISTGVCD